MFRSPELLKRVALASLIANVLIVVTGGAVRLTGSGLGCPTWPKCTADSYTATSAMGVHGIIEFGNRTLTGVVGLLALAALFLAWRSGNRRHLLPAALVLAGIPAQGVVGGFTVLTKLNPWVVACHFLVSMAVIVAAYILWAQVAGIGMDSPPVPRPLRALVVLLSGTSALVIALGTVVTGSGPHAGDADAKRTGLDPQAISQLHTDAVFLLLGLTLALWLALKAVGGPTRAVGALILVEIGQGAIGFVQYFTHLPALLVGAHMAGACAVWIATIAVWHTVRSRR